MSTNAFLSNPLPVRLHFLAAAELLRGGSERRREGNNSAVGKSTLANTQPTSPAPSEAARTDASTHRSGGTEPFWVVLSLIMMLVAIAGATLHGVAEPGRLQVRSANPTPYGYTRSLVLFYVPVLILGGWLARHASRAARRSFGTTILILVPLGFVLDLVFGNAFFLFPNHGATLGWCVPALGGPIPVEEFLFYIGGFMMVLLTYIWADEYWLSSYQMPRRGAAARSLFALVRFDPGSLVAGALVWCAALLYKKLWAVQTDGFPWYLTYLVLAALVPAAGLFQATRHRINWRAFSLTFLAILLVSVIWEVTLAVPYGWWAYRPEAMIGLTIPAWSDLPIEAVAVWLVVTFDTVMVYHAVRELQGGRAGITRTVVLEAGSEVIYWNPAGPKASIRYLIQSVVPR